MRTATRTTLTAALVAVPLAAIASNWDDQPVVPEDYEEATAVAYSDDGRFFTEEDIPTYFVAEDGTVDWPTFSGFRRYHAECHVCHGPDGEGSSYAPKIKNSALHMGYYDFYDVVVNGRQVGNSVMPGFGDNPNVMCYLDDIYSYLVARGMEDVPRGRPAKKEQKSATFVEDENGCMG
ncbi:MAG: c-type cytochrome, methanol metabolism-related [Pseudomonadota bacterium]